ncbi:PP2C family serine/threonine-protein phosphatase [Pseudorhodoferax sp. Leaf274]|uniref:PP2C family protein-serine/threonine phosphatase n=1 Tax=Pseudorhodoferax sp. Leaf274 TaxID=1736318 RepID=UPI0007033165|nr:protein phosphatase 2C domain-containing protein [Pseudorhodoferax sp. Leaf274]KQP43426.1 serine/threonine protein phosphatase [Pseudorhodoferax sp. Leaf274]
MPQPLPQGFRISAATGIHKGDRQYQQDQVVLMQHPRAQGCLLGVVADGMGGRSGGREAADQVLLTARQLFERFDPVGDDGAALLRSMVAQAHMVIKLTAISAEQEPHSTIAAFLVLPKGECLWAHVGDSRIYHFHQGRLIHRTRDHSYVQTLVDRGELSEEQARVHPDSNILIGCLGSEADPPLGEHRTQLAAGDVILACSDGVWHYFNDAELGVLLSAVSPRDATELLVEKARSRSRGGGDNLSLVVVGISPLED